MLRATVAPLGPTVSSRGVFDVTAYGADPTATHDSTDAIQSAVRAAMNSATHRTMGTVLFPSGSYTISRTINVTRSAAGDSSGVVLLGSGVAEITQQCFGCDVFFGAQLWRFTARQLWLRGGRHQLHVGNGNTNQGFFLVDDVQFENSSGVAINIIEGTPSTKLVVRDCKFNGCDQVLVNRCDWSTMETSWIEASCDTGAKGVIENHNHLFLRDILGVPCNRDHAAHRPTPTRWIDNFGAPSIGGGYLHVRNFRFGGEMGGFLPVANFAAYLCHEVFTPSGGEQCGKVNRSGAPLPPRMRSSGGASIVLEGCSFAGSYGHAHAAEVYLVEIPGQLVVRDSWFEAERDNASYAVVGLDPAIDLDGPYLANPIASASTIRIEIAANNWGLRPQQRALPAQLGPFVVSSGGS